MSARVAAILCRMQSSARCALALSDTRQREWSEQSCSVDDADEAWIATEITFYATPNSTLRRAALCTRAMRDVGAAPHALERRHVRRRSGMQVACVVVANLSRLGIAKRVVGAAAEGQRYRTTFSGRRRSGASLSMRQST